tara:strand:+ start:37 stop:309 length:273 start_codon:yes stop_codon:yes gene_type:complete
MSSLTTAYSLIEELKLNDLNLDTTLLPKHNPYVGYFPSVWPFMIVEPRKKDVSTQTETTSYFTLGKKIAKQYGDGWELLCSNPSSIRGTK